MEFVEGRTADQRLVDGKLFPKVFLPANELQKEGIQTLVHTIKKNKDWLQGQLLEYSALLFRGFAVNTAGDFRRVVEAFGWEEQAYYGGTSRTKVDERVFTANEAPLDSQIEFHHEMAMIKYFPSKVFFFCQTAPPKGGQTAIVPSHIITERMEKAMPGFVEKLKSVGLLFKVQVPGQTKGSRNWQTILGTHDPKEAQKRAEGLLGCTFNVKEDGIAEFVFGPLEAIRTFPQLKDRTVWFNTIAGYGDVPDNLKVSLTLGDGCGVPSEAVDEYKRILDEECVDLNWKEGDVLLVDNLALQHARRPSGPPRVVLASLCK